MRDRECRAGDVLLRILRDGRKSGIDIVRPKRPLFVSVAKCRAGRLNKQDLTASDDKSDAYLFAQVSSEFYCADFPEFVIIINIDKTTV